jgi:isocitrate dehydrogenase (NAD+)
MKHTITLLPGDGIGPEVSDAVVRVLSATGLDIEWERRLAGVDAVNAGGGTLPEETLESIRRTRVALKGPITTPVGEGFQSVNVGLRKALDLYVSLRPVFSVPGVKTRYEGVDLVVFRENTEGLYAGREHEVVPGVVEALKIITANASERIARYAFEYARWRGRRKVTVVHKASVMKLSDGLFLERARAVAQDYPFITVEEMPIDKAAMRLVLNPHEFDVLLMENLYGDIMSDLCSGFVGGLGVAPGANIGDKCAVFEAVHGSAPDIAGQGKANPTALLQSAVMMLDHIGEQRAARRVEAAIARVLSEGKVRTGDLGGRASTSEYTQALIDALPPEPAAAVSVIGATGSATGSSTGSATGSATLPAPQRARSHTPYTPHLSADGRPVVPVLPGDLLGRDLMPHALRLADAAGARVEWLTLEGEALLDAKGQLRAEAVEQIRACGVALRAPFSTPEGVGNLAPSVALRKRLSLYAGVRHIRSLPHLPSRHAGLDLVVVRENTEDVYAGLEHTVYPGVVESIKVVTQAACERVFTFAHHLAEAQGRKSVSIVHKANIMKKADGLFLRVGKEVGARFPHTETRAIIVDNACMQLVQRPEQFDVLVCGNLYGDILSDLGAGLVGGISAVWGEDHGEGVVVFEAIHGRAPELVGADLANPLPVVMPVVALLRHIGQSEPAARLERAALRVLSEGRTLTRDLGGDARTSEVVAALEAAL